MRRSRFLPCGIAVLVVFGLLSGCSRGPSEEELARQEMEGQLATLQQQFQDLQQARAVLLTAEVSLAEIEAIKERDRSEEQIAQLEELPAQIETMTAAKDEQYDAVQATLADFLNVALNDFPDHPGTIQGLNIYADEAILIARDTVFKAGDYKKAINQLDAASNYYDSLDLPPYQPLVDEIAVLDEIRFITKERFDLVKKNMTMDEVKEIVGYPYYQNIQKDEKRGVETWLYRKREGGAAAVYFKMKTSKMYNKNFEAVKMRVVQE
jgi:hypothetical protein